MYQHYKPLRNLVRQFPLLESLHHVWQLSQHVHAQGASPYPGRSLRTVVFPWEVSTLARELVLHASERGSRTLADYDHLVHAVNAIRKIERDIHTDVINPDTVLNEISAMAHLQFPWQNQSTYRGMLRYWRLYSGPTMAQMVRDVMGLDIRSLYQLGVAVTGHLVRESWIDTRTDFSVLGLTSNDVARFYEPLTTSVDALREATKMAQRYDRNWMYAWNPMEATPLIRVDATRPYLLMCPIPEYQLRAFSKGIFYALVNAPDFANAFGHAFERYIGDVLRAVFAGPMFRIRGETPYAVAKDRKHGTDWIVTDHTAHLFIECKTKRMTLSAKMAGNDAEIETQLTIMASAIAQLYKNIRDAKSGHTAWPADGLPIYPVIITLEDWHLFMPAVGRRLEELVAARLQASQIPLDVVRKMPYTLTSAEDFEQSASTAAAIGLHSFFREKSNEEYAGWMLRTYIDHRHRETAARVHQRLFWDDWKAILPEAVKLPDIAAAAN